MSGSRKWIGSLAAALRRLWSRPPDASADGERRRALRALLVGAGGVAVASAASAALAGEAEQKEAEQKEAAPKDERPKHQWGMTIDLDRCTGCGGCVVACQVENNVAPMGPELSEETRGIYWMDLITRVEGEYPDLRSEIIPMPCMHCEDPPCVKVCPVGATYKTEEGITAQIWDRCIGCRYCQGACPYSRRQYNWAEPSWAESELSALNPDVATRPVGVIEKCTFCQHRIRAAKESARADERALTDADLRRLPACAQACPAQAITFGDLNDPKSEVSRLQKSPRAFRLLEELGAKPRVVYLRETKWRE